MKTFGQLVEAHIVPKTDDEVWPIPAGHKRRVLTHYSEKGVINHNPEHSHEHLKHAHITTIGGVNNGDNNNLSYKQAKDLAKHLNDHGIRAAHYTSKHNSWYGRRTGHQVSIYHDNHQEVADALNKSKFHHKWMGTIGPKDLEKPDSSHSKENHVKDEYISPNYTKN